MDQQAVFYIRMHSILRKACMKPGTAQFGRAASILIAVVILLGTAPSAQGGEGNRFSRTRHAGQTQIFIKDTGVNVAPRPVADETPVDPKQFNNASDGNFVPASYSNRPPEKRKTIRRW